MGQIGGTRWACVGIALGCDAMRCGAVLCDRMRREGVEWEGVG